MDEAAMLGALAVDGTVIGVLADKLLQHCSSAKYRKYLMKNDLVLISPFYPEAGFNVGNAMQRNKYIYCLADAGLVVHSGMKGGTWTGAKENIKKGWVPLWVKETQDEEAGNGAIVAEGARWVSSDVNTISFEGLINGVPSENNLITTDYDPAADSPRQMVTEASPEPATTPVAKPKNALQSMKQVELYAVFLQKIEHVCGDSPKTINEISQIMSLSTTQLERWLNQAQQENKVQKLFKPVRYAWVKVQGENEMVQQGSLAL